MSTTGIGTNQIQDLAVTTPKISSGAAADGTVLTADGAGNADFAQPRQTHAESLYKDNELVVSNSTAVTSVFQHVVPADTLVDKMRVHFRMWGRFLNNTGSSRFFDLDLRWGATTIWKENIGVRTASVERLWLVEGYLYAWEDALAADIEAVTGQYEIQGNNAGPTTGFGTDEVATGDVKGASIWGSHAADRTVNNDLELFVSFTTSHANLRWFRSGMFVDYLRTP